jgi:hypothetical protein
LCPGAAWPARSTTREEGAISNSSSDTGQLAFAGPLEEGARVGLQVAGIGTYEAHVLERQSREVVLGLTDGLATAVEEGSVVDMTLPLPGGMYKWICLVRCWRGEKAEVQLLDAPVFVQRRLDPRVGVGLAAEVRVVREGKPGAGHQAVVADLSRGGLKLTGAKQLRAGDLVEVTFELSTLAGADAGVTLAGRVVMAYPSPTEPGATTGPGSTDAHVSFTEGQDGAVAAVRSFVAQQLACRWRP